MCLDVIVDEICDRVSVSRVARLGDGGVCLVFSRVLFSSYVYIALDGDLLLVRCSLDDGLLFARRSPNGSLIGPDLDCCICYCIGDPSFSVGDVVRRIRLSILFDRFVGLFVVLAVFAGLSLFLFLIFLLLSFLFVAF